MGKLNANMVQRVENFLSEHFKSYVLIAYDYDGVNVVYRKLKSQEEMDALSSAFMREAAKFDENVFGKEDDDD